MQKMQTVKIKLLFPGHPSPVAEVVSGKGAGLRVISPPDLAQHLEGRLLPSQHAVRWEAEMLWGKRWKRPGRNKYLRW